MDINRVAWSDPEPDRRPFLVNLVEEPDRASSLLLLSLRLPLFFRLTKKLGEALPVLGGKVISLTEVQVIAQPLLVGTMSHFRGCIPAQAVLELCLQSGRDGKHADISEKRTDMPFRKIYRKPKSGRKKGLVE
jgi:hypothetical protein